MNDDLELFLAGMFFGSLIGAALFLLGMELARLIT